MHSPRNFVEDLFINQHLEKNHEIHSDVIKEEVATHKFMNEVERVLFPSFFRRAVVKKGLLFAGLPFGILINRSPSSFLRGVGRLTTLTIQLGAVLDKAVGALVMLFSLIIVAIFLLMGLTYIGVISAIGVPTVFLISLAALPVAIPVSIYRKRQNDTTFKKEMEKISEDLGQQVKTAFESFPPHRWVLEMAN